MLRGAEELKAVCRKMIGPERKFRPTVCSPGWWWSAWGVRECAHGADQQGLFRGPDPDSLTTLLTKLKSGVAVKPGPQSNRQFSAPASGLRTLLESDA